MSKEAFDQKELRHLEEGWLFYNHAWYLLHEILRNLKGERILDVGCGTGLALSVVQAFFPYRICKGVEPADDARPYWDARGLDVEVASATDLPFAEGSFDTVYSSHVVEHIHDDSRAVREILRVARQRAIIVVPDGDVQAKSFGSLHVQVYNRISFAELIRDSITSAREVRVFSLPHIHMSNLVAIIDEPGA